MSKHPTDSEFIDWLAFVVSAGVDRGIFRPGRTASFSMSTSDGWTMTRTNASIVADEGRMTVEYVNHIDPDDFAGDAGPIDVALPLEGIE